MFWNINKKTFYFIIAFVSFIGCTETITSKSGIFGDDISTEKTGIFQNLNTRKETEKKQKKNNIFDKGNNSFLNTNAPTEEQTSKAIITESNGNLVDISLVNASIPSAAKVVLGDVLKKRYIIDGDVSGSITIQSTGSIPKNVLLELFEASLDTNGASLKKSGDIIKIISGRSGNKAFRLAEHGTRNGANIIVAALRYISATQMSNLLEPLINDGLTITVDQERNILIMIGQQEKLEAALDALNLFDVDVLSGKSIGLFKLEQSSPEQVIKEVEAIFKTQEGGSLEGVIEFIPNKRLGAILVITSQSFYLERAEKWITDLDVSSNKSEQYLEVYHLKNRAPEDLVPIFNTLLSGQSDSSDETSVSSQVAADSTRNALLVKANRGEHQEIKNMLNDIDISPQQVLLEATIAEVTLNDELNLGVRWFLDENKYDMIFTDSPSGSIGSNFPGFSALFSSNGARVALNALSGVTDVKIISSPTLMALDNQEAILQIGDQVPIATQSSTPSSSSENASTITNVEYRDTGVILRVKPNINQNNQVMLNITQEISSVSETRTSGIDSPTIRQRKIATNVLLNDETTLALGGLVQENNTETITKVPILGDIPYVGNLFSQSSSDKNRSELIILIRPKVIFTHSDAQEITNYWRSKLSRADSILKTGLQTRYHKIY